MRYLGKSLDGQEVYQCKVETSQCCFRMFAQFFSSRNIFLSAKIQKGLKGPTEIFYAFQKIFIKFLQDLQIKFHLDRIE